MGHDNREWPDNLGSLLERLEALVREHPGEEVSVTTSVDEGGLSQLRGLDGRLISIDNFDTGELQMGVEIENPHPAGVMKGLDGITRQLFNVTVKLLP